MKTKRKTARIAARVVPVLWGLLCPAPALAANWDFAPDQAKRYLVELQLDPYYSAVGLVGPLTGDTAIKVAEDEDELSVYTRMLKRLHKPCFWLAELSLNPMPIAGVWIKSEAREFYDGSEVLGINAVRTLTDGFPEPGAFSFFLGNVDEVVDANGEVRGRGYGGLLVSGGAWHILDNEIIDDFWIETELKLKGATVTLHRELSWSFAVGGKFHFHREISNALYLSLLRSHTDRSGEGSTWWSPFRNSTFEYRVELDVGRIPKFYRYLDKTAIRYVAMFGKRWPIRSGKNLVGFDTGVLRQVGTGYSGDLGASIDRGWFFLFRPAFGF